MMWRMKRTNIYLEAEQTAALDRLASDEGTSRAEMIRRLLDRALVGGDSHLDADLAAIDSSFGALADEDFEVDAAERGDDDRQAHLARLWAIDR